MPKNARRCAGRYFLLLACLVNPLTACQQRPAVPVVAEKSPSDPGPDPLAATHANSAAVPAWLGKPLAKARDASKPPVVLFDSFHAHNFLHRGLVPGEYSYHHFTGLRRAAKLLEQRGCEVRELLVGPLTARQLAGVQLVVLNLPSTDRPPWLVSEIEAIETYVRQGGGILFITDHSNCYYHQYHLLPLWDRLGLTPTFETLCERKADCMLVPSGAGWILVRDLADHPATAGVRAVGVQTGGRVAGEGIVAWSSNQAWADAGAVPLYGEGGMGLFGDMRYSASEEEGKQGIVLARAVGLGRVVVISDQNSIGDAFLSYADNWQLWLSSCKWCGQFPWDDASQLPPRKSSNTPSNDHTTQRPAETHVADGTTSTDTALARSQTGMDNEGDEPTFRELVAGEPDRNAPPVMAGNAWSIHCWEPLDSGRFYWGGTDPEQYYYFWCWLNRWYWTSANDRSQRPREYAAGRPLLLAVASDAEAPELIAHARQTLIRDGKVIWLPQADLAVSDSASNELAADDPAERPEARQALERAVNLVDSDAPSLDKAQWSEKPIPHWRIAGAKGTTIVIANARALRNARFSQPEVASSSSTAKWENELRQWLFEQP